MTNPLLLKWSLLGIVFILPLLFLPLTYLAFELPKVLALYIFSGFILTGFLLGKWKIKLDFVHHLAFFFLFWLFLSSLVGVSFETSFFGSYFRREGLLTYICYILLFFAAPFVLKDEGFKKKLSVTAVASSIAVSLIGIAQFISLWIFNYQDQPLYNGRIISTFGQPNFLGSFLVQSLPFFWYLAIRVKSKWRLVLFLGSSIVILAVILTFSRASWLALIILICILTFKNLKLLLAFLIGLTIVYAFIGSFTPSLFYHQVKRFEVDINERWTAENRGLIAQRSLELIVKRPITGWGVENFALVFPMVIREDDLGLKDIVVDSAHNIFLNLGVEGGIVGMGIFMAFLVVLIKLGLKKVKEEQDSGFIKALMMVVVAFLITHQFSVLSSAPFILFWICCGGIAGSAFLYTSRPVNKIQTSLYSLVILIPIFWFVTQNIRADILFREAQFYEVADIKKAIELDSKAFKIAPWVKYYLVRRDFLLKQMGN